MLVVPTTLAVISLVRTNRHARETRRVARHLTLYHAVLEAADLQPPPESPPPAQHRPVGGHLRRVAVVGAISGALASLIDRTKMHPYAASGVALAAVTVTGAALMPPSPSSSGPPQLVPLPGTSAPHRPVPTGAGQPEPSPSTTTSTGPSPDLPVVTTTESATGALPTVSIPDVPIPSLTTPTTTLPTETTTSTPTGRPPVTRGLCVVLTLRTERSICLLTIRTPAPRSLG
jgi:hypothetical protein